MVPPILPRTLRGGTRDLPAVLKTVETPERVSYARTTEPGGASTTYRDIPCLCKKCLPMRLEPSTPLFLQSSPEAV